MGLKLKAIDASRMMISNNASFDSAVWIRLKENLRWKLPNADGEHTVYAKFADEAGNETEVFTDKVILDRQAPIGSIIINHDSTYSNQMKTFIRMETGDAVKARVSNTPTFDNASWGAPVSAMTWVFKGLDGTKSIYMQLVDKAGNVSETFSDSIKIDTEAPIVRKVMIDNDISAAKEGKKVQVQSKVYGATFMMISNSPDFSSATWEPFFAEKEWTLESGEGDRFVYLKFKDDLGNESQVFSDKIQVFEKLYHVGN